MSGSSSTRSNPSVSSITETVSTASSSNIETLSTSDDRIVTTDVAMLGRKWFEWKMTERAIQGADDKLSLATRIETRTSSFNYAKAYATVQAQVNIGLGRALHSEYSLCEAYHIAAGFIRLSGSDSAKVLLDNSIDNDRATQQQSPTKSRRLSSTSDSSTDSGFFDDDSDEELPLFSMALNEHTCGANKYLKAIRRRLDPPLWEVAVRVDRQTWFGRGKSIKTARLKAARNACTELGIVV